jgi:ketosteroid isomerase-like protein
VICERGSFQSSLVFGTRDGGSFELPFLRVSELDERGKVHRIGFYDFDQIEQARARFAEIATAAGREAPFANTASRSLERNARCWAARDWEGALAILSPALRFDDRRRMMRLEIGYEDFVAQFRMLFDQPGSRWHESLLGTRGERLALTRTRFEAEVAGGGGPLAFDDHLSLTEVDADGRWIGAVTFDLDDEDAAFAELDARFDRGEATLHPEVWAAQKARSRASRDGDSDAFSAYCAPSSVSMDHRSLGFPSGTAEQQFQRVRAMYDLAPDARARRYHIRMSSRGLLFVVTWHGTRDGAAFEIPLINVDEVDAQGLVRRHDGYAPEQIDLALARFAELQAPVAPPAPFANAASRALDRGMASWRVRDWEGYEQDLSPDYRFSDRRKLVQLELDRPQAIQYARESGDMAVTHVGGRLLATRGDRLSLSQVSTELSDESVGPSRIDSLNLTETDERGALLYSARFDPDALDAAYAELDARFEAGEGAHNRASEVMRAFARAFQDRDWQAMRALLSPSLVCHDHRLLGWGTLHGAEAFVATQRTLTELAPDTRFRLDHIRVAERATLHEALGFGTRDGGAYELPFLRVTEFDAQGLIARFDFYDVDRIDEARARFDELSAVAPRPLARFANAATRNVDGATAAQSERDWQGFGAFFAPGFRSYDRRAMVRLETGREQFLASYRQIVEMTSSPPTREVVATRGDRLALVRIRWLGADGDVGPSEIDWLLVVEVDGRGDQIAGVAFDEDDVDAAYAELDARFDAGEGTAHLLAAAWLAGYLCGFAARDWDSMTALLAPDLIGHNHRLVGWGTLHGPKALVSTMRAQVELAPDTQERVDHVRTCERGVLFEYAWHGTYEGGAFENVWIVVIELDALGRARRADVFEAEQLDQAQARFDEIASARPPWLANAAARVLDALVARWSSRDWPGYAQLFAAGFHYSDRRPLVRLELDLDRYMAFVRQVGDMAISRYALDVIATRGERLALTRSRNEAAEGDVGPSEIESLVLFEIGEDGALCNAVRFALDDLDAAYAELDARWAAGEAAIHPSASAWVAEWRRGFAARDWQAMAALTAPDQVAQNHRLLGWGTMSGPGAWVRALEALVELAPDTRLRVDHLRTCARGFLWTSLWHGTRDGGAFETPWIMFVELDAHGKEIRVDVWDIEQIDEAYERFESLRATTPGWTAATDAQSNAASVAMERWRAAFDTAFASGDWEPMRALCAPEMLFDDHRRLALLSGDRELMIASARERVATGARPEISPIGTAGERVAAVRVLWGGGPPGGRFEIEYLCVAEVDADGLISAIILIDTADAREVRRKAWARWAAIDPIAAPWLGLLSELTDAWNAHDRERVRARFADDVVVEDHRHAGLGRIEGVDAYVESFDALWDLAPEQWVEFGWSWAAVDRHGIVLPLRRAGTLADGGAFESDYLWLGLAAGGRITRLEAFEVDALDEALARFAELARA